jgi:hypothetical protein
MRDDKDTTVEQDREKIRGSEEDLIEKDEFEDDDEEDFDATDDGVDEN